MSSFTAARLSAAAHSADSIEGSALHYDPAVLESMRRAAQTAFDSEGKPVLGILLGRRTHTGTSVTAWLPAHAFPSGQEANLARAYELARLEYPSEEALGWFRSKHQGEARLPTEELERSANLLPGGQSLALVLRPSSQRPMRVSSYVRTGDEPITGERPTQEFFIHPAGSAEAPQHPAARSANATARQETKGPILLPTPFPAPTARPLPYPTTSNRFRDSIERLRWAFPVGLLILIAMAAVFIARYQGDEAMVPLTVLASDTKPAAAAPASGEALKVSARNGMWQIHWTPKVAAGRATLEIGRDGKWEAIALSPNQYSAGLFRVPQHAGDLEVLLRHQPAEGPASELRARVVGSAIALPPAAGKELKLSVELQKVKTELQAERTRFQQLKDAVIAAPASAPPAVPAGTAPAVPDTLDSPRP